MKQHYKSILLVDDDMLTNYLTKRILDRLNIAARITIANNGKEALDYIDACIADAKEECIPDLIFLDINMPVMTGIEFLEAYQQKNYNNKAKIVMLTTSSNERDKAKTGQFNISGYLIKPVTIEKINTLFE